MTEKHEVMLSDLLSNRRPHVLVSLNDIPVRHIRERRDDWLQVGLQSGAIYNLKDRLLKLPIQASGISVMAELAPYPAVRVRLKVQFVRPLTGADLNEGKI